MFECPHCKAHGISVLRKIFLGPALPARCIKCNEKVGVPWIRSLIVMLLFYLPTSFIVFIKQDFYFIAGLVLGALFSSVFMILYLAWVPLEKR